MAHCCIFLLSLTQKRNRNKDRGRGKNKKEGIKWRTVSEKRRGSREPPLLLLIRGPAHLQTTELTVSVQGGEEAL